MNDKNNYDIESKTEHKSEPAVRARNRTVMLTPEITGQVRAKLGQAAAAETITPPNSDISATISPQSITPGAGFYSQVVQPTMAEAGPRLATPPQRTDSSGTLQRPADTQQGFQISHTPGANHLDDLVVWTSETPLVGFLVSYDTNAMGDICSLRTGRLTVTSALQAAGSYLYIDDESVSPNHAIIRISATGEIQVLDQLSESGTHIRRFGSDQEIELSGDKSFLEHGDIIRFGSRTFYVTMIIRGDGEV